MNYYLIKNNETGRYVSQPGSEHSYTTSIKHARKWTSREAAKSEACQNETVVDLNDEIGL